MHENNHCQQTGEMSSYGQDFKLLSKKFPQAAVDKIVGNWVDIN